MILKKPLIIGLGSTIGIGKDTVFSILEKNYSVIRIAFADAVKDDLDKFCIHHYGISAHTQIREEKSIIRPLLIGHGNAMRAINPDHWVNKAIKNINFSDTGLDAIIFTDVRFPNEVQRIKSIAPERTFYVHLHTEDPLKDPGAPSEVEQYPAMAKLADYYLYNPMREHDITTPEGVDRAMERFSAYVIQMYNVLKHICDSRNFFESLVNLSDLRDGGSSHAA